jgi:fused signal recognition particle receptor
VFKFFKEKLKGVLSGISEKIEKDAPEVEEEVDIVEEKVEKPVVKVPEPLEDVEEVPKVSDVSEKKSGFFGKLKGLFKKKDEVPLEEVEEVLRKENEHPVEDIIVEEEPVVEVPEFVEEVEEEKVEVSKEKVDAVNLKIREEIEKGVAPSLQELAERKVGKVVERKVEERVEKKSLPSVQDIAFGRTLHVKDEAPKKEFRPLPSVHDIAVGKSVGVKREEVKPIVREVPKFVPPEIEKFKSEEFRPVVKEEIKEVVEEEKKGFFAKLKEKIVTKKISDNQFDELFWDLEVVLLENNVAVEVIEKIKLDLKHNIVDKPVPRNKVSDTILNSLKKSVNDLFDVPKVDIFERMEKKKPIVICFLGVNGSGKTTTIAKIAFLLQKYGFSCVIAAADTFRAAAIDQLEMHAKALGVKLIKHDYGADPAAVAFDAVKYASAKGVDAVLIDTAGRLHSNTNLMDEMKKIVRVANPDLKIFVGESITGNDCVEQAKQFNELVGIDGIVLAKADVDEKGGAAISIGYVTKKPILYLGVGQRYEDLEEFDSGKILEGLGF